jgi:altronate dehydratase small subunit
LAYFEHACLPIGLAGSKLTSHALFRTALEEIALQPNVIIINEKDNVGVALADIADSDVVRLPGGGEFRALERIPFSHKVALDDIDRGRNIIKYGEVVGQAGEDIKRGALVHTHNLVIED